MLAKIVDRALLTAAIALALSLTYAAWHDVSQAYDVWYYHLPFAGRLTGVLSAESFTFSAENQARFEGFPLLAELVQGILWRITGHVSATNLVAIAALFGLPAFLWRFYKVPLGLALLAFLAIPLVQIHATSSYIDLPANALVTMLVLCVHRAWVDPALVTRRFLVGAGALAAAAANMKFQLVPIVGIAAAAIAIPVIRSRDWRRIAILAIAAPLVLATPLKNLALHGNPVWPVELHAIGHEFPSVEKAYSSSPDQLEHSWRPTRFIHSALELDNRPIASHERWSLDQWTPPSEPAYRMGGYFGAYVAINLLALGFGVFKRRNDRKVRVAGIVFGAVTVVAAFVPQSHELRYYMHWMLTLVAFNLALWHEVAHWRIAMSAVTVIALAVVGWSTEWGYLYASGSTFDEFLAKRVDASIIESAPPNARLCIEKPPFTMLYAPKFHPRSSYSVQEKAAESDCR